MLLVIEAGNVHVICYSDVSKCGSTSALGGRFKVWTCAVRLLNEYGFVLTPKTELGTRTRV